MVPSYFKMEIIAKFCSWTTTQTVRHVGTINSKINGTSKGVYFSISKLHSILAVANLLAHNNISQICYCDQISLQSAAVNCSFSDIFGGDGTHCTIGANSVHLLIGFVSFVIKACQAFVRPPSYHLLCLQLILGSFLRGRENKAAPLPFFGLLEGKVWGKALSTYGSTNLWVKKNK